MKQSKLRRKAMGASQKKKKLAELELEREQLIASLAAMVEANPKASDTDIFVVNALIAEYDLQITVLKRLIKGVPFVDDIDLRYNRWDKVPNPTTQAVMFCLMDVSGSMGEWEKEMAKRFFMLLYLFLTRQYEKVEIVFIRHHTIAKEVDEQEFFYSQESGGTIVSPALELMHTIITERYPKGDWNVYACQASDGDNWDEDNVVTKDYLTRYIMPLVQYFAYVEIKESSRRESDLWPHYVEVKSQFKNFDMTIIQDAADIYPVFRGLFEKEGSKK